MRVTLCAFSLQYRPWRNRRDFPVLFKSTGEFQARSQSLSSLHPKGEDTGKEVVESCRRKSIFYKKDNKQPKPCSKNKLPDAVIVRLNVL